MQHALIIYGSNSGNTAYLAQFVKAGLEKNEFKVEIKNAKNVIPDDFNNFDLIVLGCSTWDGQKVEGLSPKEQNKNVQGNLQPDMKKLLEELNNFDFRQKPVAIYGVGHYSYTFTANAANLLEEFVLGKNGKIISPVFKVTDVPDLFADAIEQWAKDIKVA